MLSLQIELCMAKDYQRSKLYEAENKAGVFGTDKILSIEHAGLLVQSYLQNKWLLKKYPFMRNKKITVQFGYSKAWANDEIISLPFWGFKLGILIHEFAHIVHKNKWPEEAGHNWRFANIYMSLARKFISVEFSKKLRNQFKILKVKFNEPTKR